MQVSLNLCLHTYERWRLNVGPCEVLGLFSPDVGCVVCLFVGLPRSKRCAGSSLANCTLVLLCVHICFSFVGKYWMLKVLLAALKIFC